MHVNTVVCVLMEGKRELGDCKQTGEGFVKRADFQGGFLLL